jgi:hypothetical protein
MRDVQKDKHAVKMEWEMERVSSRLLCSGFSFGESENTSYSIAIAMQRSPGNSLFVCNEICLSHFF